MRIRIFTVILAVTVAIGLAGCGGSDTKPAANDLAPRLAKAKTALDGAETIHLKLSTTKLPSGVNGLLSADGNGNHSPAFKGKVKVVASGASLGADVIAVGGTVYAKVSFSPTFLTIDPASLKAPDPAALVATTGGVSDLLIKSTKLSDNGKSRAGSLVLTSIKGTLPGAVVQSLVPSANAAKPFMVTYRLTDKDELYDATITGPFYPGADSLTYTVSVTTSSTPVTITKP